MLDSYLVEIFLEVENELVLIKMWEMKVISFRRRQCYVLELEIVIDAEAITW